MIKGALFLNCFESKSRRAAPNEFKSPGDRATGGTCKQER